MVVVRSANQFYYNEELFLACFSLHYKLFLASGRAGVPFV